MAKKHLRQNISPSGTVVPGGLIIIIPVIISVNSKCSFVYIIIVYISSDE